VSAKDGKRANPCGSCGTNEQEIGIEQDNFSATQETKTGPVIEPRFLEFLSQPPSDTSGFPSDRRSTYDSEQMESAVFTHSHRINEP